jgi:DNA-binding MarR family transcriptional regulator
MTAVPLDPATETFLARRRLVQGLLVTRLATLRQIAQRSASIALGRATGLNDFDWLVISFVGLHQSPAVAAEIGERLQRDKAQVSRALSRLTRAGYLSRDRRRAPLLLTSAGREVYARLEEVLVARNETLLEGAGPDTLALLDPVLDKLFKGANAILAHERAGGRDEPAGAVARPGQGADVWRGSGNGAARSAPKLVMPDLHVLLRLLRRSAELAYGRVTGLKNFDWRTLTHIEMSGPLTLADLIVSLDRNKSQVGRAVTRLVALGLVRRRREKGVPSAILTATPSGRAAFEKIIEEAQRREQALVADLTHHEHRAFVGFLDRVTHNALDLLARERAGGAEAEVRRAPAAEL